MAKFKNLKAVRAEELKLAYEEDLKKTPTSPGVVIVRDDDASQAFVRQLAESLAAASPHAMLNAGIRAGCHGRRGADRGRRPLLLCAGRRNWRVCVHLSVFPGG